VIKLGRISDFSNIVAYGHKLWRPVAASSPSVTYQLVWLPVMNNSVGFLPQNGIFVISQLLWPLGWLLLVFL